MESLSEKFGKPRDKLEKCGGFEDSAQGFQCLENLESQEIYGDSKKPVKISKIIGKVG